jgi:hypothetical protein
MHHIDMSFGDVSGPRVALCYGVRRPIAGPRTFPILVPARG